jgi:TetR/AcrR family transcriptional repressor of nem operon
MPAKEVGAMSWASLSAVRANRREFKSKGSTVEDASRGIPMRRSREDTAKTRRKIVDAAARLFRARGVTDVSIADVMRSAGLTVGGFRRHFPSKEALVAEAIELASQQTAASLQLERAAASGVDPRAALLDFYASDDHRAHPESGCPVAALCSEMGHEARSTKRAFTIAIRRLLDIVAIAMGDRDEQQRKRSTFVAAALVGGLVLSRASADEALAEELLVAIREGTLPPVNGRTRRESGFR